MTQKYTTLQNPFISQVNRMSTGINVLAAWDIFVGTQYIVLLPVMEWCNSTCQVMSDGNASGDTR